MGSGQGCGPQLSYPGEGNVSVVGQVAVGKGRGGPEERVRAGWSQGLPGPAAWDLGWAEGIAQCWAVMREEIAPGAEGIDWLLPEQPSSVAGTWAGLQPCAAAAAPSAAAPAASFVVAAAAAGIEEAAGHPRCPRPQSSAAGLAPGEQQSSCEHAVLGQWHMEHPGAAETVPGVGVVVVGPCWDPQEAVVAGFVVAAAVAAATVAAVAGGTTAAAEG